MQPHVMLVSADSHVIEPPDLWTSRVPSALVDRCPRTERGPGGEPVWVVGGEFAPRPGVSPRWAGRWGDGVDGLASSSNPARRLREQDEDGVSAEVLYPSDGLWRAIDAMDDAEAHRAAVRAYNEWIAEFTSHDRSRLVGLARIPVTGLDDATREVERAEELGLRGVILSRWPNGTTSPDDDDRFWKAVEERGLPVSVHGGFAGESSILGEQPFAGDAPPFFAPLCAFLAFGGTLDRCPRLRFVVSHADAGWLPSMLDSDDDKYLRAVVRRRASLPNPDWLPSDYIRRFFWFTWRDDRVAIANRRIISRAHLMWASLAPLADSAWPNDRVDADALIVEAQDDAPALFGENCARLYGIDGAKDFTDEEVADYERVLLF